MALKSSSGGGKLVGIGMSGSCKDCEGRVGGSALGVAACCGDAVQAEARIKINNSSWTGTDWCAKFISGNDGVQPSLVRVGHHQIIVRD
jgi:hypothetical protein